MRNGNVIHSFRHAYAGLAHALSTQRNLVVHLAAAGLVLAAGRFLSVTLLEYALLVVAAAIVIVSELVNTAVEAVVDLAAPELDPLARVAKDVAAASVLVAAVAAIAVGGLVLGPHLLVFLGR